MRRSVVITVVLVAIAFVLVGGPSLLFSPTTDQVAPEKETEPELVAPEGSESGFWPYLSAREVHDERSPINLVVRGDAEMVVYLMSEEADGDWEETDLDHFEVDGFTEPIDPADTDPETANGTVERLATEIPWTQAAGTTRYAYLDPGPEDETYWADETLQLDDGDYYGQRYHIRLYESPNPDDRWVVMQAHTEHFDWFTLRHRVDGVEAAQSRAEADLLSVPTVDEHEDVVRINLGNSGPSDADGWATKVDLTGAAVLPVIVGLAARNRVGRVRERVDGLLTDADRRRLEAVADRVEPGHVALPCAIVGLLLGVRIAGIGLERHADVLSMHAIAALLYPVIAVGIPTATYLIASGLERRIDAAVVASTSLAIAIWIDYGLVGVDHLPIDVVVQRAIVVVALGLIAGGAARRATRDGRVNDMLVVGAATWVLALVGTLFGLL